MNLRTNAKWLFLLVALLGLLLASSGSAGAVTATIWYVKDTGSSSNTCADWANACDLQTAIGKATAGNQIWVAAGTYTPGTTLDQFFVMKNGVAIYGGFGGTESALSERNSATHLTVLSGDIDHDDVVDANGVTTTFNGVNSRNVVIGSGTDSTAVLDGFTVTGGKHGDGWTGGAGIYVADGSPTLSNLTIGGNVIVGDYMYGGGLFTSGGSPALTNVTFTRNQAGYGGGMSVGLGSPSLKNVVFRGNTAAGIYGGGAALWVDGGSPVLTNVVMSGNKANYGGGMAVYSNGSATLTNVTISGNSARDNAGGVFVYWGSARLTNSILWGNSAPSGPQIMTNGGSNTATVVYSDVQSGCGSIGGVTCDSSNIDMDPLFVAAVPTSPMPNTGGNLRLTASSPAINVGSNTAITATGVTTDLDGNQRVYPTGGTVDLGAYEYQGTPIVTYTVTFNSQGGTALDSQNVASGSLVAQPADPTKAGFTFGGWYKESGCTNAWAFGSDTVTSNVTLYAKWTAVTYTVTYDGNTATGTAPIQAALAAGATFSAAANTFNAPSGKQFKEWNTAAAGDGTGYAAGATVTMPASNLTLYAIWENATYSVSFNAQGGSPTPTAQTVASGGYATEPTAPTKTDYTFGGWYTDNTTYTTQWNFASDAVAASITLYAKWTAVTFTLSYNANAGSGTAPADRQLAAGTSFTAAPASTFTAPTGKQFKQWNTAADGLGTGYAAGATVAMPASNLTLYAIWENIATTPVVTTQPQNQKVVVGQTATFTAGATGYDTVKWQVSTDRGASWIDVPSATALTLSFPATIGDNGNRYRAVFTSAAGSTATNVVSLTVGKANTTASLNSDANPSTNAVTFTATVRAVSPGTGTPTGTVTFLEGRTVLATKRLDGSGIATSNPVPLSAGTHSITAQYSGDASFNGSTSSALSQVVNAPAADVGIDITSGTYNSGSRSITWTLKVTNVGPATAKAVVVTDTLPKGTKLTNVTGLGSGSYGAKGSTVTIALGDVASGSTATVTLTIDTGLSKTPASGTTFVDTATVSTSSTDNNTANNRATRSLTIP